MIKTLYLFTVAILVTSVLIASAIPTTAQAGQATAAQAPQGDAKRGADYFLKYGCWECHGYTGQTGTATRLITSVLNARGFINYLRNPKTNQMPLYSAKVLPDQEAADIYAYIKTFKQPPELKNIPLLQQILSEK